MQQLPPDDQFPRSAVVMFSGGIDSTALLYLLRQKVERLRAVVINYGQRDFSIAYGSINRTSVRLDLPVQLIDVPNLARSYAGVIEESHDGFQILQTEIHNEQPEPDRNSKMNKGWPCLPGPWPWPIPKPGPVESCMTTSMAGVYAFKTGFESVSEGVNKDDLASYPFRTRIHDFVSEVLSVGGVKFRVFAPFLGMSRVDVTRLAVELGVPFAETWSCWENGVRHCGQCRGCQNRRTRLREAGVSDPTIYRSS